ncbi:MAG: hypothetical protein KME28_17810 [Pelatocladus maniniholoensis HA4357-MV3]|jgi:hypothetical protein|uniref:Uncharacterized protein n=1 Tax=Pelatocladus maniniholoensis HA4357-MV3 TaxID=1117104 RepID=A0A9E3HB63_9NOST|nr:hypothetical protein [Pelatocladus maniniholoensis HA4357-MV3]BAZ68866.1 hypothetical protein NIES4106_36330 [Fischerella sp. NIES-4106]
MPKQPKIKINDRIRRRTDDGHVYYGVCIKLTEKGIRCKWDKLPEEYTTVLLYKNYGEFWEKYLAPN